jgi:hypothetical protein
MGLLQSYKDAKAAKKAAEATPFTPAVQADYDTLYRRIDRANLGDIVLFSSNERVKALRGMEALKEDRPAYLANLIRQGMGDGFGYVVTTFIAENEMATGS